MNELFLSIIIYNKKYYLIKYFDYFSIEKLTYYKFFTENVDNYDFKKQGIKNIHTENPISELFFIINTT